MEISVLKVMSRTEFQNHTMLVSTQKLFMISYSLKKCHLKHMVLKADIKRVTKNPTYLGILFAKANFIQLENVQQKHFKTSCQMWLLDDQVELLLSWLRVSRRS